MKTVTIYGLKYPLKLPRDRLSEALKSEAETSVHSFIIHRTKYFVRLSETDPTVGFIINREYTKGEKYE